MSVLILQKFSADHPFNVDELNTVLDAIAGTINGLAGSQVLLFTPLGGNNNTAYVPQVGGDFTGPITAPAIQVGLTGSMYPVLTTNDRASLSVAGPMIKAAAVSTITQTISGTYVKAEMDVIQTKVND